MKIIAVGMNYAEHNKELHPTLVIPKEPVIFMKPDSALLKNGKPFFIPDFSDEVHYETELVVKISRLGKNIAERFADRYYDEVTVGIDFTARDLQRKIRETGNPWEICKGFDDSAAIGEFVPVDKFKDIQNLNFHLDIDGKQVQKGNTADMSANNYYYVDWDLTSNGGQRVASGVYLFRASITSGGSKESTRAGKIVILAQ